jgi:hypothetical protein
MCKCIQRKCTYSVRCDCIYAKDTHVCVYIIVQYIGVGRGAGEVHELSGRVATSDKYAGLRSHRLE